MLEFCPRDGSPLPAAPLGSPATYDPLLGTTIDGRYAIEAALGEGGMGVVYKARHVLIDKTVAIKILRKEAAQDAASVQRFIQEAKSASKINHSNIVDITDFGVLSDGHAYFVMEFLQGQTLAQAIHEGPLDPVRVCVISAQMARGLHAAHQKGIVHRDLKPENIFLLEREGNSDYVKIVDFGIAKVGGGQRLTQVGMVLGTPEYMSPEQATGQETDHRVDQYALGCIMYEMLTGVVPFLGERPAQTLTKHVFEAVVPPTQRKPELGIPAVLEAVVLRTVAKKPAERFPSMRDLELSLSQVEADLRAGRVVDDSRLYRAASGEGGGYVQGPQGVPGASPGTATQLSPQPVYSGGYAGAPNQAAVPGMVLQQPSQPVAMGYPPPTSPMMSGPVAAQGPGQASYASSPPSPVGSMPPMPAGYAPGAYYAGPGMMSYAPGQPVSRPTRESLPAQRARQLRSVLAMAFGGALFLGCVLLAYLFFLRPPPVSGNPAIDSGPGPGSGTGFGLGTKPPDNPPVVDNPLVPHDPPGPILVPHDPPEPPTVLHDPPGPVAIVVRYAPGNATVYVDNERCRANPCRLTRSRGAVFRVEARKSGYSPYAKEIRADKDQEVPVMLSRVERGHGPKKKVEVKEPERAVIPPSKPSKKELRDPF